MQLLQGTTTPTRNSLGYPTQGLDNLYPYPTDRGTLGLPEATPLKARRRWFDPVFGHITFPNVYAHLETQVRAKL
jgi:hypothetical protein